MKIIFLILITLFVFGCNSKTVKVLPQKDLSGCHGLGIVAEDIAQIREKNVSPENTFNQYIIDNPDTPKSLHPHIAVIAQTVFDYPNLKPETFLHTFNYTCLASRNGVSMKIARPYLLKNSQNCQDNVQRPSMVSGCIQHAYNELLRSK